MKFFFEKHCDIINEYSHSEAIWPKNLKHSYEILRFAQDDMTVGG